MEGRDDREAARAARLIQAERRFEEIWRAATTKPRLRLDRRNSPDRVRAAKALTLAWEEVHKARRISRSEFEGRVADEIVRAKGELDNGDRDFRLGKWTLPIRDLTLPEEDLQAKYEKRSEPQKMLLPYIVAIGIAAGLMGRDRRSEQIGFLQELDIWARRSPRLDVHEDERDVPAENVVVALNALARHLEAKNGLRALLDRIRHLPAERDPFTDRLLLNDGLGEGLEVFEPTIEPNEGCEGDLIVPFPGLSLVRIPYAVISAQIALVPVEHPSTGGDQYLRLPPTDASWKPAEIIVYRDIRLVLGQHGRSGVAPFFETRGAFAVRTPLANYAVRWIDRELRAVDLIRGQGIVSCDGSPHRLFLADDASIVACRNGPSESVDFFEADPFCGPDPVTGWRTGSESGLYWTHARLTPRLLRHWLATDQSLRWDGQSLNVERVIGPSELGLDTQTGRPRHTLNFPNCSVAVSLEWALHDGSLETALQARIDQLRDDIETIEIEWHRAREDGTQSLLSRWQAVP